ncbi:hypothetical protein OE88DRAFT_1660282 [Heliocybe sulcata]|uniref:Uncharacterized protein n=1 Tax=Heliocybe sulcata TaxID=5364 RepID=A0A5C3NB24_9AGAM|nr:hypothetical protein OE88DRAFT_1660282 [Heliocybe sulcata]
MAKRVSSPYELIDRIRGLMGKVEPGDRIENWRKEVMPERFGDKGLPGKVKRGSGTDHKPVRGGGMAETHSSPCARKMGGGVARKRTVRFAGEGGDKKSHRKDIAGTERKVHEHKTSVRTRHPDWLV